MFSSRVISPSEIVFVSSIEALTAPYKLYVAKIKTTLADFNAHQNSLAKFLFTLYMDFTINAENAKWIYAKDATEKPLVFTKGDFENMD